MLRFTTIVLQEIIQRTEDHGKWHHKDSISKIQTVGNSRQEAEVARLWSLGSKSKYPDNTLRLVIWLQGRLGETSGIVTLYSKGQALSGGRSIGEWLLCSNQ